MSNSNVEGDLHNLTRTIISQVSDVYKRHTDDWLIGLVVHGSAAKGGFIYGWSDIDFQLYVEDHAFENSQLPLKLCLSIQNELSKINPYPYQYIQTRVFAPSHIRYGGLVPNTYELVMGRLLLPEFTDEQLFLQAESALNELNPIKAFYTENLLEHGNDRLLKSVRAFCTLVWPTLYQMLTILTNNGVKVWGLTKAQAIAMLPRHTSIGRHIHVFHEAVLNYASDRSSVEYALHVIRTGVDFLQMVKCWWDGKEASGT